MGSSLAAQVVWDTEYWGNGGNDTLKDYMTSHPQGGLGLVDADGLNGKDIAVFRTGGGPFWYTYDSGNDDRGRAAIYDGSNSIVLFEVFNGTDWDVRVAEFLQGSGNIVWSATFASSQDDIAGAVIRNSANQIFVTCALHNGTDYDWLVVRYDTNGVAQSAQILNWGLNDIPVRMAADNSGNVYIAGTSDDGASGGVNVRVAKITSSGAVGWSVPYDGGVGADTAVDIACDNSGNCYVTGTAATATGEDVLLLRVTSSGSVDWNRRFNGGVPGNNLPAGVARDTTGGCVVSGSVYNGTDYDWFTARYDNLGVETWRDNFATPNVDDLAQDIAVDGLNNACSAGIVGNGAGTVIWTLLINSTGARAWTDNVARPDAAGAFAVFRSDTVAHVAATFSYHGNTDTLERTFNPNGSLVSEYKQPEDQYVEINRSAMDASGNTYAVGYQYFDSPVYWPVIVKFDAAGNQQWVRVHEAYDYGRWKAIEIAPSGDICVCGEVYYAAQTRWFPVTAKYSPSGDLLWLHTNNLLQARCEDIQVDSTGAVYTLAWGTTPTSPASSFDVLLFSYSSSGTPGWTYTYGTDRDEFVADLHRDAAGNLYIAGNVVNNSAATGWENYLLIKVDSTGSEQWVRQHHFNGNDKATSIATDAAGNVYAAGECATTEYATGIVSYDSTGTFRWQDAQNDRPQSIPTTLPDLLPKVHINGNGDIWVASVVKTGPTADLDMLLLRYNSGGTRLNTIVHDVDQSDDTIVQLAHDSQNRIFLLGSAQITNEGDNIYLARFSPTGALEWDTHYGLAYIDTPFSVVIDSLDLPTVVGRVQHNPGRAISVRKFGVGQNPTDVLLSGTSVDENSPIGTVVGLLSAADPTPSDSHTFMLVTGPGDTNNATFTIVGNELRLATSPNYETAGVLAVRIRGTDTTSLFYEVAFVITVNDLNEAPLALTLGSQTIDEGLAPGSTVGVFNTTEPDIADTHLYALVPGAGDTDNALFTVSGSNLLSAVTFDFEVASVFSIRVRTTDSGGLEFEATFNITVTDLNEAPTLIALTNASVLELHPVGTLVGTFSAQDPDAGDSHTYSLVSGARDAGNASFSISEDQLLSADVFDLGVQSSYSIRVRATDSGGAVFEQEFIISILLYDAPTDIQLSAAAINENQAVGALVGTLSAVDRTVGDTHAFTLVAGLGDGDNTMFSVSGDQLLSAAEFDFEQQSSFSIRIRATDSNTLFYEKVFIITVNDLDEGQPPGGSGKGDSDDDEEEDEGCRVSYQSGKFNALVLLIAACALCVGRRRANHSRIEV